MLLPPEVSEELSHHSVADARIELAFEAYETSELAITLNRNFISLAWTDSNC